jgi:hypothetical protein
VSGHDPEPPTASSQDVPPAPSPSAVPSRPPARTPNRLAQLGESAVVRAWKGRGVDAIDNPSWSWSSAPGDNLQKHMNLVMPLADPTAVGRARAVQAVAANIDELFTGLNNVGTVHMARFDIIGPNLCMFSVFDGDFTNYIRDFICVFGSVFDAIISTLVEDPPTGPTEEHPEEFVDWVKAHDAYQIPGDITQLFPDESDVQNYPRDLVLLLEQVDNLQIGRFSAYPGLSAAQLRLAAGIDW